MGKLLLFLLLLTMAATLAAAAASADHPDTMLQSESLAPQLQAVKLSHLRFYFHDTVSGHNPTAVRVAQAPSTNTSSTSFGMVDMIDDPLTTGPEINSTLVGRAQGLYGSVSQEDIAVVMAVNLAFVEGKYNGSTITVLGRNVVLAEVREMPIVGGSGHFRYARGYVKARTYSLDMNTGYAIVEYNVFVLHN